MFSRSATGLIAVAVTVLGRSDFVAATNLGLGTAAVALGGAPEEALLAEELAGLPVALLAGLMMLPAVPGAGFEPGVPAEAGFVPELLAGVELDAAAEAGFASELLAGVDPGVALDVGFVAELFTGLLPEPAVSGPGGKPGMLTGAGLGAAGAGLTAEVAGDAGFGVCGFGAGAPAGAA